MILSKISKNIFLLFLISLVVSACATKKTTTAQMDSQMQGMSMLELIPLVN